MSDTSTDPSTAAQDAAEESRWVRPHENIGTTYSGTLVGRFKLPSSFGNDNRQGVSIEDDKGEFLISLDHKELRRQMTDALPGDFVSIKCVRKNVVTDEASRVPKYVYEVHVASPSN